MNRFCSAVGVGVLALILSACGNTASTQKAHPPKPHPPVKQSASWLVTLTAESGTLKPATGSTDDASNKGKARYVLQLGDVDDQIVAFTDRPDRQVVVGKTARFVESWKTIFADDPPNAVLIQHDPKNANNQYSVVVELQQPTVNTKTGRVEFPATVLGEEHQTSDLHELTPTATASEKLLLEFDDPSLFVDAFPTSVNDQITDSIT